ncbi:hypothetical protein GCM10023193_50910 [Planotetraspora kaengkrachanensis]|uniref:Uncharacterized protein n=1 Tax=Planotetraspora kaengkrachanensis TaxID=575193 RepID=A0A8J3PTC4_9ACTN|nr:hypothetical protein Pka01_27130 [Planotetraspora kaengkrachanensis]
MLSVSSRLTATNLNDLPKGLLLHDENLPSAGDYLGDEQVGEETELDEVSRHCAICSVSVPPERERSPKPLATAGK